MRKALIFRVRIHPESMEEAQNSLEELKFLLDTLGVRVISSFIQNRHTPDRAYFVGKGKLLDIENELNKFNIDLIVSDNHLFPKQQKNLEKYFNCEVLDRTAIIIDIFRRRAQTHEGKIQVEIAELKYKLSRLIGKGKELSRQGGGIGTRGVGEKKLELDRRRIKSRLTYLKKRLKNIESSRKLQRKVRKRREKPIVSLVGYTNAGKSSLLKAISKSNVYIDDRLFATLDPLIRRVYLGYKKEILMSDTVGFIRNIPPFLIDAFKSTLEEILEADLIINVVDLSDPAFLEHEETTIAILSELGALNIPRITVYNKIDKISNEPVGIVNKKDVMFISVKENIGIDDLKHKIKKLVFKEDIDENNVYR